MQQENIRIQTPDGSCRAVVVTPEGQGPWPAVIFYMDAFGLRPALVSMAQRIAAAGYVVLLPDMLYRVGDYEPLTPAELFKGDYRAVIGPMMATTGNGRSRADTGACLAYLATRKDVAGVGVGTVGFCMGGGMALTAAGAFPEQVAAAASFHGGNLATDAEDSPHLLAGTMRAEIYVAGADNDKSYPPAMAERLEQALSAAGVSHRLEVYANAAHGWMKPDFPVYDEAAAERGWQALLDLFDRRLRKAA